ncbi:MAG: protein kinase domain-containing protein [Myxococcota bacterium]
MAELFLAYTAGPGGFRKFVALKQILPDVKADEQFVKMFLDEARLTATLTHSNIGQVFDLGEEDGELYLAMEFIAGQNLEQVLRRSAKQQREVPVGFACRVVRDACLGLHYAHTFVSPSGKPQPVVHRDVSPKNVMVTYSGEVKVIDFGIAKARGRLNRTQVGVVKGTSGYMSPEQVRNEQLDGRSDLFSAGALLYELLTGQRAFAAVSEAQMMLKIAEAEVGPPRNLNPRIPPALDQVVMRALSRKREQRFAHGKEMARAIEEAAGAHLLDEDGLSGFMRELFEDKISTTRSLLDLASKDDDRGMSAAVRQLRESDAGESKSATPKRPSGRRPAPVSPTDETEPSLKAVPNLGLSPPQARKGTQRPSARMPAREQAYSESDGHSEESTDRQRRAITQEVPVGKRRHGHTDAKKGKGGLAAVVVAVLLMGVLAAAFKLRPGLADTLLVAAKNGLEEPPPPPPPSLEEAMKKAGPKPQWLVEKEKHEAEERRLREEQAAIEAAVNSPEMQEELKKLDEQIAQLDRLEEEQRTLKMLAKAGQATGAANSARISQLERQIAELRGLVDKGRGRMAAKTGGRPDVISTKSATGLAKADAGRLVLTTVKCMEVFEGGSKLGATCDMSSGQKIQRQLELTLPAGRYAFTLRDPWGGEHPLNVDIEAGKTREVKGFVGSETR